MAGQITGYSAQNVTVTFLGKVISGFAEGDDVIQVERNKPTMTQTVGVQGDGMYSQTADKSGKITLKLLQGCEENAFLTKKIQASEVGGIATGELIITEVGNDAKVTARKCVIEGMPKFQRGEGNNAVEWTFLSTDINITQGAGVAV